MSKYQGSAPRLMSEAFANHFWVFPSYQEERGATVAKIVKAHLGQLSLFEYWTEIAVGKIWDGKRCTLDATKDEIE